MRYFGTTTDPQNQDIKILKQYIEDNYIKKGSVGTVYEYDDINDLPSTIQSGEGKNYPKENNIYIVKGDSEDKIYLWNNELQKYIHLTDKYLRDALSVTTTTTSTTTTNNASANTNYNVDTFTDTIHYKTGDDVEHTIAMTTGQDTTYNEFIGSTSSVDGKAGLVKQPLKADRDRFLRGDKTWQDASISVTKNNTQKAYLVGVKNTDYTSQTGFIDDTIYLETESGKLRVPTLNTDNIGISQNINIGRDLVVEGTSTLKDKVTITKNGLEVTGNTTLHNQLTVDGTSTLKDKVTITKNGLEVTGNTTLHNQLTVDGTTTLRSKETITSGGLEVTGDTTLHDKLYIGEIIGNYGDEHKLYISAEGYIGISTPDNEIGITTSKLDITGDTEITGSLSVSNSTILKDDVLIKGNLETEKDVNVGIDLYVHGKTDITGDLCVGGTSELKDKVTITKNGLEVTGNTTLHNQLTVDGTSTLKDKLTITKNGLEVTGDSNLHDKLIVDGISLLKSDVTIGQDRSTADLTVTGDTTLQNALTVYSTTSLEDSLTVDGASTLNDKLTITSGGLEVTGLTDLNNNLNVDGTTTLRGKETITSGGLEVTGDTTLHNQLIVDGTSTLKDKVTITKNGLEVTGNTTLHNQLTVDGISTLKDKLTITSNGLEVTGDSNLHDKLIVDGTSTLKDKVTITKNGLEVTGLTDLNNNLNVDGTTTLRSKETITSGGLEVTGDTTLHDKLYVGEIIGNYGDENKLFISSENYIDINSGGELHVSASSVKINTGIIPIELKSGVIVGTDDAHRDVSIRGELTVYEDINGRADLLIDGNAEIGGGLGISGETTLEDKLTITSGGLEVTGLTDLNNNLNVDGTTTLRGKETITSGGLEVTGDTTLHDKLTVDGTSTLKDKLTITKNGLEVTGSTKLNNSLEVKDATTLKDNLDVYGETILESKLTAQDSAEFQHDVEIGTDYKNDSPIHNDTELTVYGNITSPSYTGLASNATNDDKGQKIQDTYIKNITFNISETSADISNVNGKKHTVTEKITHTKGNNTTATLTQTTYYNSYETFVGSTSTANGKAGLVTKPEIGDQYKFLRGDSNWAEDTKISTSETGTKKIYIVGVENTGAIQTGYTDSKVYIGNTAGELVAESVKAKTFTTNDSNTTASFIGNLTGLSSNALKDDTNQEIKSTYIKSISLSTSESSEDISTTVNGLKHTVTHTLKYRKGNSTSDQTASTPTSLYYTYGEFVGAASSKDGESGLVKQPLKANYLQFLRGDGTWANDTRIHTDAKNAKIYLVGVKNATNTSGDSQTGYTDSTIYIDGNSNKVVSPNFEGELIGNASTATQLKNSRNFSITGGIEASAISFNGTGNVALNVTKINLNSLSYTGIIPFENLPAEAQNYCLTVADDTERLALTKNDVQNGDTVKVVSTDYMYYVKDDTKLGTANAANAFEIYKSYVNWISINDKPTNYTLTIKTSANTSGTIYKPFQITDKNATGLTIDLQGIDTTGTAQYATYDADQKSKTSGKQTFATRYLDKANNTTQSVAGAITFKNTVNNEKKLTATGGVDITTAALSVTSASTFSGGVTIKTNNLTVESTTASTFGGSVTINNTLTSQHIQPSANNTYNIGTSSLKYATIYANSFNGLATKATADADNNTISSTYLKRSGGTMTGILTSQHIQPSANSTYNIGTSTAKYSNVYADTFQGQLDLKNVFQTNNTAIADAGSATTHNNTNTISKTTAGSFYVTFQNRRDTTANWSNSSYVPKAGELLWESDTNMLKMGDGSKTYANLQYIKIKSTDIVVPGSGGSSSTIGDTYLDKVTTTAQSVAGPVTFNKSIYLTSNSANEYVSISIPSDTEMYTGELVPLIFKSTSSTSSATVASKISNLVVDGTYGLVTDKAYITTAIFSGATNFRNSVTLSRPSNDTGNITSGVNLEVDGDTTLNGHVTATGFKITVGNPSILDDYTTIELTAETSIKNTLKTYSLQPDANNTRNIGTSSLKYNTIYATSFNGLATKATADADNNTISSTYLKRSGGTMIGTLTSTSIQPDANNTRNIGTSSLKYNTIYATSFNGLATKATNDKDGNSIDTTYLKRSGGTMTGTITSTNIQPDANNTRNIGTSSLKYNTIYATSFNGALSGNASTATNATNDKDGNAIDTTYLKRSGGTMTGALHFANNIWNNVGDDVRIGDINVAGQLGIQGLNGNTGIRLLKNSGTSYSSIVFDGTTTSFTTTGNSYSFDKTITGSLNGNASTASLLSTVNGVSYSASTWVNESSLTKKVVWGERFSHSDFGSDTGDITLWIHSNSDKTLTYLNMSIDGTIYSSNGFNGPGSGLSNLNANNISSGTLPIARGGTGATTAEDALTNLGLKKFSFDKTLTLTTSWIDTGISGTNLDTGSYIVQIINNGSNTTGLWSERFTGIMAWYKDSTNGGNGTCEIVLHHAGHAANGKVIYLRTIEATSGVMKLQISASENIASSTYTFKFRKLLD